MQVSGNSRFRGGKMFHTKCISATAATAACLVLFRISHLSAQEVTFGDQIIISQNANHASCVIHADLDGDNDQDVLSASRLDAKIAWYENLDGEGGFSPEQIITLNAAGANSVACADLDGDGDQDVLSASFEDNKVAWYENEDGLGTFGPEQVIAELEHAISVCCADFDGDDDWDVLAAGYQGHTVVWYENLEGQGTFGPARTLCVSCDGPFFVHAADLDNDNDQDAVVGFYTASLVVWFENTDGQGTFGELQEISTDVLNVTSVYTADLDNDGDQDVLSASYADNKLAWYENEDGEGTFGPEQVISTEGDGALSVASVDLDADGDQDLLLASYDDNEVSWFRQEGTAFTRQPQVTPCRVELLANYPNPFNASTTLEFTLVFPQNVRLALHNMRGQQVAILADGFHAAGKHCITFNAEASRRFGEPLPSGVYIYRLQAGSEIFSRKMVLLR